MTQPDPAPFAAVQWTRDRYAERRALVDALPATLRSDLTVMTLMAARSGQITSSRAGEILGVLSVFERRRMMMEMEATYGVWDCPCNESS